MQYLMQCSMAVLGLECRQLVGEDVKHGWSHLILLVSCSYRKPRLRIICNSLTREEKVIDGAQLFSGMFSGMIMSWSGNS